MPVPVTTHFTLDAGAWELLFDEAGQAYRAVTPPSITMFNQLLGYLGGLPEAGRTDYVPRRREAIATMGVCIRWGSYFAVLADRFRPLWPDARNKRFGRITDSEMARINIEASAALEEWIEIFRHDRQRYYGLVNAALTLPMPRKFAPSTGPVGLASMTRSDLAAMLVKAMAGREEARQAVRSHPTRTLANTIINACWRNGPIEDIHAGRFSPLPLLQRRVTPSEERLLVAETSGRLAEGMDVVYRLSAGGNEEKWPELVLPFGLNPFVAPQDWSLAEKTRSSRLRGAEPIVQLPIEVSRIPEARKAPPEMTRERIP